MTTKRTVLVGEASNKGIVDEYAEVGLGPNDFRIQSDFEVQNFGVASSIIFRSEFSRAMRVDVLKSILKFIFRA